MTVEERKFLNRINDYADIVLEGIDPQKVQISVQLEKLRPIMNELAVETNQTIEEVFIKYMDLASMDSVQKEKKLQNELGNANPYTDFHM